MKFLGKSLRLFITWQPRTESRTQSVPGLLSVASWTCGIVFITVHFFYKVDEYVYSDAVHHWSSFQSTYRNRSINSEIHVKEYPPPPHFLRENNRSSNNIVNLCTVVFFFLLDFRICTANTVAEILIASVWEQIMNFGYLKLFCIYIDYVGRDKAVSVQTWTSPKGSRRLRLPDFKTIDAWN